MHGLNSWTQGFLPIFSETTPVVKRVALAPGSQPGTPNPYFWFGNCIAHRWFEGIEEICWPTHCWRVAALRGWLTLNWWYLILRERPRKSRALWLPFLKITNLKKQTARGALADELIITSAQPNFFCNILSFRAKEAKNILEHTVFFSKLGPPWSGVFCPGCSAKFLG